MEKRKSKEMCMSAFIVCPSSKSCLRCGTSGLSGFVPLQGATPPQGFRGEVRRGRVGCRGEEEGAETPREARGDAPHLFLLRFPLFLRLLLFSTVSFLAAAAAATATADGDLVQRCFGDKRHICI